MAKRTVALNYEAIQENKKEIEALDKIVTGNGDEGLAEQMRSLRKDFNRVMKTITGVSWAIAMIVISEFIRWFIEILPILNELKNNAQVALNN